MNNIKLPPDVAFHEDIRLFIYRPRGLLSEASIDKVLRVLEELEAKLKEPSIDSPMARQSIELS